MPLEGGRHRNPLRHLLYQLVGSRIRTPGTSQLRIGKRSCSLKDLAPIFPSAVRRTSRAFSQGQSRGHGLLSAATRLRNTEQKPAALAASDWLAMSDAQ